MSTVTVGVTKNGRKALTALQETEWFSTGIDVYRFAIAVGLAEGLCTGSDDMGETTTIYNVGSLESDQRIATLVRLLGEGRNEEEDVYKYAERVADAGLRFLHEELVEKQKRIADIVQVEID